MKVVIAKTLRKILVCSLLHFTGLNEIDVDFGFANVLWCTQAAQGRPGSLMLSTMLQTMSWSEPRPWSRTVSSLLTACLSGSGMRPIMPLLLDARRVPSWYVQESTSIVTVIAWHQILLVFAAVPKNTTDPL